jgi:plastocyanin
VVALGTCLPGSSANAQPLASPVSVDSTPLVGATAKQVHAAGTASKPATKVTYRCEFTTTRVACPGREAEAYKPYDGKRVTTEVLEVDDMEACERKARQAAKIVRLGTLQHKSVQSSFGTFEDARTCNPQSGVGNVGETTQSGDLRSADTSSDRAPSEELAATTESHVVVGTDESAFEPRRLKIRRGDSVVFVNRGNKRPMNVYSLGPKNAFELRAVQPGSSSSPMTFGETGTTMVEDAIRPRETLTISVQD